MIEMLPDMRKKLRALLVHHEGLRTFPYEDTRGNLTIGIGRSLSTRGITENEAFVMLDDDMMYFTDKLNNLFPWFNQLDENRQVALIDMAFNCGINGILGFHEMLDAFDKKDYYRAADEVLHSKWAEQVGQRSFDIATIIETGDINSI